MSATRVRIDGLPWCSECRRAVDRGHEHARDCRVGNWGEAEWTASELLTHDVAPWRFEFGPRMYGAVAA